jgi:hypothetical protein
MKNSFKISFLLAATLMILLPSCGKTELIAPNGNTAGNVFDGSEKSLNNDGTLSGAASNTGSRDGELDLFDPADDTSNSDDGNTKPDPDAGDYIGDDDDDSNLGNNEGKSLLVID